VFRSVGFSKYAAVLDSVQQSGLAAGSMKRPIFEETSAKAIRAAHRRKWTMVASVTLVCLVAAALLTFSWRKNRADRVLVQEYLEIDALYTAERQSFEDKLRADPKLNTPDARPDHSPSAKKFEDFAKANVASPLGWQAALRAANEYIETEKFAEAQSLLEPLLIRTLKHVVVQVRVRKTIAGLLAEQGQFDPALEQLAFLEKLTDNPLVPEVRLMKAQILYKKGQKEEAAKLLKELASDTKAAVGEGSARSVATEASLWLGYWGL
jgi:predicted negative regulator of RcsB-dependent stress response